MRFIVATLFVLLLSDCDNHNEVVTPGTITFPVTASLHAGQTYRMPQSAFSVRFDSVTSDSRCPIGVECFWAGDGATRLSIWIDQNPAVTCTLHTTLTPQTVGAGEFIVQLKELDPYPHYPGTIDPAAYVAVLQISQASTRR
jgi:hypothetical protein